LGFRSSRVARGGGSLSQFETTVEQFDPLWDFIDIVEALQELVIRVVIGQLPKQFLLGRFSALADVGDGLGKEEVEQWVILVEDETSLEPVQRPVRSCLIMRLTLPYFIAVAITNHNRIVSAHTR
jgi:hypothetical protein